MGSIRSYSRVSTKNGCRAAADRRLARRGRPPGAHRPGRDRAEVARRRLGTDVVTDRLRRVRPGRDGSRRRPGVAELGGIDVVVANAGIASYGSVLDGRSRHLQARLDINVLGVFHTVRAALPSVIEQQGYVLVVIVSPPRGDAGLGRTTRARPASSTSPRAAPRGQAPRRRRRCRPHVVDRHPAGAGRPRDLSTFAEASALPYPLNGTTSVESCGKAFVKGIADRKRHIYVPGWSVPWPSRATW